MDMDMTWMRLLHWRKGTEYERLMAVGGAG